MADTTGVQRTMIWCRCWVLPGLTTSAGMSSQSDTHMWRMRFQLSFPEHEPGADKLCRYHQACRNTAKNVKVRGKSHYTVSVLFSPFNNKYLWLWFSLIYTRTLKKRVLEKLNPAVLTIQYPTNRFWLTQVQGCAHTVPSFLQSGFCGLSWLLWVFLWSHWCTSLQPDQWAWASQ